MSSSPQLPESQAVAKVGRPSSFSPELTDRICSLVSTNPLGIRELCKLYPELPDPQTIYRWIADKKDFREQYARAKETQLQLLEDEMLTIADDATNDYMDVTRRGETIRVLDKEAVMRSNLRIETRKWLMSKLLPKKYGDKQADINVNPLVQINIVAPQVEPRHNPADLKPEFDVIEGK